MLFVISLASYGQSGIFFQAIARDNNSNPARDRKIYVQTNIIQSYPTGNIVLIEEYQTNTDAYGVFSIMVGNGVRVGGAVSGLSTIDWSNGPFYLNIKIAITPIAASNTWDYSKEWIDLGTTIFGTVPFALYSASTAKMNDKLNSIDTTKMLIPYAKVKTVQVLSSNIDTKLSAKDTSAMLSFYTKQIYTDSALRTKLNAADTIRFTNKVFTDSALLRKLNMEDTFKFTKQLYIDSSLETKMNIFDTSVYAKQFYVDASLLNKLNNIDSIKYTKKLYTDSALLTKLSITGSAASLTNFPILNQNTTGNAAFAIYAGNITATSNTTLISLSNLNTVGTIKTGIWSATAIDITSGGTGLTSAGLPGQVLTTSAIGTLTWTNVSTSGIHYVGESYGGGIVFYVSDNGKHGLIAATSDQIINTRWYGGSYTNTRARADGVGAGFKNTSIIISVQSGTYSPAYDGASFAAAVCNEYAVTKDGVTYGDWYLPSKHELNLLFLQRALVGNFPNVSGSYWSSTEYFRSDLVDSYKLAWYQNFITGTQAYLDKKVTWSVRAIRAF